MAALYLLCHLFLDWVSFIHELSPLNITPWNPPAGLIMGVLVVLGWRMVPVVWLSLVIGDGVIRNLPAEIWAVLLSNALISVVYGTAAWIMRSRLGMLPGLSRLRDIVLLVGGTALAALLSGAGYISIFMLLGLFPWADFPSVLVRYWVGDIIGITVLTPFILVWLRETSLSRWTWPARWSSWRSLAEGALQGLSIAVVLWVDFGPLASGQYEYFYLLFLPVIWIATRHGLAGATLASLVTQGGLIVAIQLAGIETTRMTHFQLLMLSLAITGLLLGAVVSERRRIEAWVRERQADFAHATRLTEAGAMTAALAHEINQPLTATMSYARAARKIASRDGVSPQLADILDKTVAQAERADRVMRSLRDFVRKGETRRQVVSIADVIAESITLASPVAAQHDVSLLSAVPPALPLAVGDPVQLQQVLLNLLRNAVEAIAASGTGHQPRLVSVSAAVREPGKMLCISVEDSGPGLSGEIERSLFVPFVTTKATGMGLGLSIARTIIEAHGGTLDGQGNGDGGTTFTFTIPAAARKEART